MSEWRPPQRLLLNGLPLCALCGHETADWTMLSYVWELRHKRGPHVICRAYCEIRVRDTLKEKGE